VDAVVTLSAGLSLPWYAAVPPEKDPNTAGAEAVGLPINEATRSDADMLLPCPLCELTATFPSVSLNVPERYPASSTCDFGVEFDVAGWPNLSKLNKLEVRSALKEGG
jgi:hypothetical protein